MLNLNFTTMENLTKYALDGLRITNQELFNKRAYEIISRYNALNLMTDGVPVAVKIINEAKLIKCIQNYYPNHLEITIDKVNISDNFEIKVKYSYVYIRYYNNKKDAENKSLDFIQTKNEEYKIPVEFKESSYYYFTNRNNIEQYGLKIELL